MSIDVPMSIDVLRVFPVGRNYLYFLSQAKSLRNPESKRAAEEQAGREREHLLQLLSEVGKEIYVVLKALATEVVEYGETERYRELEQEANRLDSLEADLHAYLDGRKPREVDPEIKAKEELLALATRAKVSVAARRALGNKPRGSYDSEVIQALVKGGVAKEPRHAINLLNLSKGLEEGWSNEELLYWAICYRQSRVGGGNKAHAVASANKSLGVG